MTAHASMQGQPARLTLWRVLWPVAHSGPLLGRERGFAYCVLAAGVCAGCVLRRKGCPVPVLLRRVRPRVADAFASRLGPGLGSPPSMLLLLQMAGFALLWAAGWAQPVVVVLLFMLARETVCAARRDHRV